MTEVNLSDWNTIPGYEGRYEFKWPNKVKRLARIITYKRCDYVMSSPLKEKMFRVQETKGREYVTLTDSSGLEKAVFMYHIVAAICLGLKPAGKEVNHKNGNARDNRPDNLEYMTHQENVKHAFDMGLIVLPDQVGENNPAAKLTNAQVVKIRHMRDTYSAKELAKKFGVSVWCINDIITGRRRSKETLIGR